MGKFSITGTYVFRDCKYCGHTSTSCSLPRHEKHCYLNPDNKRLCPVCGGLIKNWKQNATCSYACSNTYFRSGINNPNHSVNSESGNNYRTICFSYHEKRCVVCGEDKVVAVHHLDGDKENNEPSNLIPLCPTHHVYCHSRYNCLIEDDILKYLIEWSE